jgi:PTH2 family peptidyl-tRNA hydrolase
LYNKALELNIPCALIEDNGLTEFKGIKTKTCCAIGPYISEEIDKITSHLKLL